MVQSNVNVYYFVIIIGYKIIQHFNIYNKIIFFFYKINLIACSSLSKIVFTNYLLLLLLQDHWPISNESLGRQGV